MPSELGKYPFSNHTAQVMMPLLVCSGLLRLIYLLLSADRNNGKTFISCQREQSITDVVKYGIRHVPT